MKIKYFALAVLCLPLPGQEAPNRFKKIPDLPKNPDDLPVVVVNHLEHFLVAKETLNLWKVSHPKQKITRDLVSDWINQKHASLAGSFFFCTRLDQNFSLETGQLLAYPVEYVLPKFSGEWYIPSAFDHPKLGHQIDTTFSQDDQERLHSRLNFREFQFLGSESHFALVEETRSPDDLLMPNFKTFRQLCSVTYTEGVDHFVGRFNSLEDEAKALLVFSEAKRITLDPIPKNRYAQDASKGITVSSEFIDLSVELWIDYCRDKTPDQLRISTTAWITTLLKNQKATRLQTLSKEVARGKKGDLYPNAKFSSQVSSYKPTDPLKRLSPSNPLIPVEITEGTQGYLLESHT